MNVLARTIEIAPGSGRGNRWYPVVLVTLAIAISYFDRQTLPVAIARNSAQHSDFGRAVFLSADGVSALVCGAVHRRRTPARPDGHAARVHADHAVVVDCLRPAWICFGFRAAAVCPISTRHGRRRSVSGRDSRGCRMDLSGTSFYRNGHHQCRHGGGVRAGPAADRLRVVAQRLENGLLPGRRRWHCLGALVGCFLSGQFD